MNRSFFVDSWRIGRIMGIPIHIHFSWLIIFGLITWSLSTYYFPRVVPELSTVSSWMVGAVATFLLFISVAFHELSHSFVARKHRIYIERITLFIFGGVAQMRGEPSEPLSEFKIAIAGPLSSILLSVIFFSLSFISGGILDALFSYLAFINLLLAFFNLLPGFPMDGGRVLRSALWARKKNYFYATQKASSVGQAVAIFFMVFGLFSLLYGIPSGLWMMLIGWFLFSAAQASYQQSTLQEILSGVKVRDIMVKDIVWLDPSITIEEAVNEYFLRYGYGGFPVKKDDELKGFVTLKEVKDVPRSDWGRVKVEKVVAPHRKESEISPENDAFSALEVMAREGKGRIIVTENDKIVGLITRNGIATYVHLMKGVKGIRS